MLWGIVKYAIGIILSIFTSIILYFINIPMFIVFSSLIIVSLTFKFYNKGD